MSILSLKLSEMPKLVEIIGSKGEKKFYKLTRSKKRLGASLQSVEPEIQAELIRRSS